MAGTKAGGAKAAARNKEKYGDNYYAEIGKMGGSAEYSGSKGFASNRELAVKAGRKGGKISRRGPSKPQEDTSFISKFIKKVYAR